MFVLTICVWKTIKLSLSHMGFEDTSFDELLVIWITELLINILSCYDFVQDDNLKMVLACRSKLVSYNLSKGFVIIDHDSQDLKNFTLGCKQHIQDVYSFENDSGMTWNAAIPYVENNTKKIYLSKTLFNEFTSTY